MHIDKLTIKDWAKNDFKVMKINCGRLLKRFMTTISLLSDNYGKSISSASRSVAELKGIYRMLSNEKLSEEIVIEAHKKSTINTIVQAKINRILAVQDTTDMNYTGLKMTEGLGDHCGKDNSLGLICHSCIALTEEGVALGLLHQKKWTRDFSEKGKKKTRHKRPIEEKESYKWFEGVDESSNDIPNEIEVIHICDREADIFEFFNKMTNEDKKFVVRAIHNRNTVEEFKSFDLVNNGEHLGTIEVEIPRDTRNNRPKRTATLELKTVKAILETPQNLQKLFGKEHKVEINVVLAREINSHEGIEPIEWYLVTNLDVENLQKAISILKMYVQRWKIERFHYVLKSGCKIEELQNEKANKLKMLILIYSIISIKILSLTYLSRAIPDKLCEEIFEENEWKILYRIANKTTSLPDKIPTLKEFVGYVAKLGGFLGRKCDGEPGAQVIWKGLRELAFAVEISKYLKPSY